ncbi:hypothetical protein MMC30_006202 [Trapelia coarctata]|nr:hypothetical protein [Trapelia coarctata]
MPQGGMPPGMQQMQQMQEQFSQMRMDPHQDSPPLHGGGHLPNQMRPEIVMIDPRLPINSNGKVQTLYEGYRFAKAEDVAGPSWARVLKTPLVMSQDILSKKAKEQASGRNSVLKILNDRDMRGSKKMQVENLVAERNIEEPDDRFEWKPAYIDTRSRTTRRGNTLARETVSMEVVLKRIPRLVQLHGRPITQPLSGEFMGLDMAGGMHQGHGMEPMYMPAKSPGMPKSYPGGHGEPILEIAPGFSKGRPGPQHPGPPNHGPQNHGPQYPALLGYGAHDHGPPMQGPPHPHGPPTPPHHGPPHGPPPPPPHGGPHGDPHGGIEVLDDHFEPHGQNPMSMKPKKDKKDKGHGHFDQTQDFGHMPGTPKSKKKPSKIDIHNPKPKEKVERWEDHDSSSDYEAVFSDNETVLTPGTSVSSDGKKYRKHREVEYPPRRRDSYRDGKRPHREHARRSPPPPSPRLRRPSLLEDEYVIVPKKNIFRDVPLAPRLPISDSLRRLSSVRDPARPPLTGHSYTYDSPHMREARDHYEPRRQGEFGVGSLVQRGSEAQPRRMPDYDYPPEDRYRDLGRGGLGRERERERGWDLRDRELREQELAELRRRERDDQYFGRPERLTRDFEATYRRPSFR